MQPIFREITISASFLYFSIFFILFLLYLLLFFTKKNAMLRVLSWPIKRISNANFNKLLDKYSSDENKDFKGIMIITYTLLYLFFSAFVLKIMFIFFKQLFIDSSTITTTGGNVQQFVPGALYELLLHMDLAGIIIGFLGILFGIIIALMVDGENRKEKEASFATIYDKSHNLLEKTNAIVKNFTAVQPKYTLRERLDSLKSILALSLENEEESELYIMSYSADLNYMTSHNMEVVLNSFGQGNTDISKLSQLDYHKYYRKIDKQNTEINDLIEKLVTRYRQKSDSIHMAILNTKKDDIEFSQYEKYLEKGLERADIIYYDQFGEEALSTGSVSLNVEDGNVYYAFAKGINLGFGETIEEKREELKEFLYANNLSQIDKLVDWGYLRENIHEFDSIPFQFVLTKSITGTTPSKALITLTNIDALGKNGGIFSYETTDPKTLANLVNIFNAYSKSQESRDNDARAIKERRAKFSNLFNANTINRNNIATILKYKFIDTDNDDFYPGVPKTDIKTAVAIREAFYETLGIIPLPVYIGVGEKYKNVKELIKTRKPGVYVAIGIFGSDQNPPTVAEYIINSDNSLPFELVRKSTRPKKIEYKDESERNIFYAKFADKWVEYEEKWVNDDCADYGIIAKLTLGDDISVFIIGGLNHYGTEKIGAYLRDAWETIADEVGDNQFLFLYDIPEKQSSEPITLREKRIW
ncbi:hypothetical protein [Emticicia sp. TH156]|uniref:hypothetical protein n=1 Tax=Emticicia sp. TH156 TaxID=2067454 RepID=UPI000C784839|nr:hypothetical protein [Emticicia sp. TH156]PLK44426.1 hypothetical protein C0V77_11625 [Emticicia sp. TH156]